MESLLDKECDLFVELKFYEFLFCFDNIIDMKISDKRYVVNFKK